MQWDLAVTDPHGTPVMVAELKAVPKKDPGWATRMRDMLVEGHAVAGNAFFLLVTLDESFLWRAGVPTGQRPDMVLRTTDLLGEPYQRLVQEHGSVGSAALEHLVGSWLLSLTGETHHPGIAPTARGLLERFGVLDALRGGRVSFDLVA